MKLASCSLLLATLASFANQLENKQRNFTLYCTHSKTVQCINWCSNVIKCVRPFKINIKTDQRGTNRKKMTRSVMTESSLNSVYSLILRGPNQKGECREKAVRFPHLQLRRQVSETSGTHHYCLWYIWSLNIHTYCMWWILAQKIK